MSLLFCLVSMALNYHCGKSMNLLHCLQILKAVFFLFFFFKSIDTLLLILVKNEKQFFEIFLTNNQI